MARIPDGLPQLRPGRHRRRGNGVCLMEYTSILAGERFSDHPRCTDPVLAAIARAVNDYSSDGARQRLAVLASELTVAAPAGVDVGFRLARRCLLTALPYADSARRRVITVGLLGLDRAARGAGSGWTTDLADADTELALIGAADELAAAGAFLRELRVGPREYLRRGLPVAVEAAVRTIAREAADADEVLARMLAECLADVRRSADTAPVPSATCAESSDTSARSPRST